MTRDTKLTAALGVMALGGGITSYCRYGWDHIIPAGCLVGLWALYVILEPAIYEWRFTRAWKKANR